MTKVKCNQCGAMLKPYWLKDGTCSACRRPESVVAAVLPTKYPSYAVFYIEGDTQNIDNWKTKETATLEEALDFIKGKPFQVVNEYRSYDASPIVIVYGEQHEIKLNY